MRADAERAADMQLPADVPLYTMPEHVLAAVCDTKTPQGVAAVLRMQRSPALGGRLVALDGVQDPGNVGTILRTADALDIPVILLEGCADPYSHKVVRSSMGAVFRTGVVESTWEQVRSACKKAGISVAVTALSDRAEDIRKAELNRCAVVIGSEGQGVRKEILDSADMELIIPMNPRCESLNAAIAAAIVMWQMKQ